METVCPGSRHRSFNALSRLRTTVVVLPGSGRRRCLPNWHAEHMGRLVSLQAATCRSRVALEVANTPVRMRNCTFRMPMWSRRLCQCRSSFSAGPRLVLVTAVVDTVLTRVSVGRFHDLAVGVSCACWEVVVGVDGCFDSISLTITCSAQAHSTPGLLDELTRVSLQEARGAQRTGGSTGDVKGWQFE